MTKSHEYSFSCSMVIQQVWSYLEKYVFLCSIYFSLCKVKGSLLVPVTLNMPNTNKSKPTGEYLFQSSKTKIASIILELTVHSLI